LAFESELEIALQAYGLLPCRVSADRTFRGIAGSIDTGLTALGVDTRAILEQINW